MAGVSITESTNLDLDVLVAGGDAFMARIKTLQDAKAQSEKALENLNLGRDAISAMHDAQAREAAASKIMEDGKIEVEKLLSDAKIQAASIVAEAKSSAAVIMSAAQAQVSDLDAQVISARKVLQDWSDQTTAEANSVMAKAVAAQAAAEKQLANNQETAKELAYAQTNLKISQDAADRLAASLQAKLDAIKVAASE